MRPETQSPAIQHERHFGDRVVRCFSKRAHSVWALVSAGASLNPDKEAVVDGDERLTYRQLSKCAQGVHAFLIAHDIRPGDRVALLMDNSANFIALWAGMMRAGVIAVPLNPRERRAGLGEKLHQCEAKAIWFDEKYASEVPLVQEVPSLSLRWSCSPHSLLSIYEPLGGSEIPPAHQMNEDDPAVLLYTSGSSGVPKGALLTHLNLVHSAKHMERAMQLSEADRSMLAVPLSHVTGLVATMLSLLAVGGTVIILGDFKARRFIEVASAERMTHTLVVPAIYNLLLREPLLLEADLSHWRIGGFGGAPMPQATIEALALVLPSLTLANGYGATETCSPTTVMPLGDQPGHIASIGKAVECAEILVMDEEGREVPRGEPGELWIAGPMVIPGYFQNPGADLSEFVGRFWRSGDIGKCDTDGYVYILDRKKDLVNRGGYKVFSSEVEDIINRIPGVLESALIGVSDPVLGEKSCAFVVFDQMPADARSKVRDGCARVLADYQVPDFVVAGETPLRRNPNGKIDKPALRATASAQLNKATP